MSITELSESKINAPSRSTRRQAWVKTTRCDSCHKFMHPKYGIVKDGQSGHREILTCTNCGKNPYHHRDQPHRFDQGCRLQVCPGQRGTQDMHCKICEFVTYMEK